MIDEKEIRDVVEIAKRHLYECNNSAMAIGQLISLAERWLAVKGLTEKKDWRNKSYNKESEERMRGYNQAIDDCRLAIAKHYISREEHEKEIARLKASVPSVEGLERAIDSISSWGLNETKEHCIALAIHDLIQEKLECALMKTKEQKGE